MSRPVGTSSGSHPTIGAMMLLIVGIGVGLAVVLTEGGPDLDDLDDAILALGGAVLGGVALVGVPMLLRERWRRPRRRFGPGEVMWFAQGTSAWLLWPPVVVGRISEAQGQNPPLVDPTTPQICFLYGTPLMAVYMTASLLAGGWLRRRGRRQGRRRAPMRWRERFGLLLGMSWAVLGLYVLSMIYRSKFR